MRTIDEPQNAKLFGLAFSTAGLTPTHHAEEHVGEDTDRENILELINNSPLTHGFFNTDETSRDDIKQENILEPPDLSSVLFNIHESYNLYAAIPPDSSFPAISIIIPMYNAGKYIGECLDSLLAQTFQNFEVIVVDDCSTDKSSKIVKSYMSTFNGRLRLEKTEKNSGGCAVPRNTGFPLARGEYVYFMDSDDVLTQTALEEMYALAKDYDAEVVYCERYYMSTGVGEKFVKNIHPADKLIQDPPYVDKPTFEVEDLSERVQSILHDRVWPTAWLKLVRRDLLDRYKIIFSKVRPCEDILWTYGLIFFAKKFLRVPNMVYIRRMRNDSIMGIEKTPQQKMYFWLNPVLLGIKNIDDLMGQVEFFQENSQQRYVVLQKYFQGKLIASFKNTELFSSFDIYKAITDEFGGKLGESDVLVSALCTHIFDQSKASKENLTKLKAVENQLRQSRPDVSVIVSMYNLEKYIGECLDSLLAQTFKNFEVIVVDDCSEDNSIEVVKSYFQKFNGRLKLAKTIENTGNPSVARNMGVDFSRGEYLLILDGDDTITPDAIEKLYKVAKEYDADVVTCEKFYPIPDEYYNDPEYRKQLKPWSYQKPPFVNKPTLVPFDLAKRAQDCADTRFVWELWDKLVRRDHLIENQIRSQNIMGQDFLVVYCLIYTAKRFVRVPYVINYYRKRKDSLYNSHNDYCEPIDRLKAYLTQLNVGLKYIDELLSKREFFKQNPEVKRLALKVYLKRIWNVRFKNIYDKIDANDFREALREEFGNNSNALLTEIFFDNLFDAETPQKKGAMTADNFEPFITARIDIKLQSTAGDLQILSVSDKNASVSKPAWLQKNGVGYQFQSRAGKIELIAKAAVSGKISIWLKGMDVRNPKDHSKRIPYWIDYTRLAVNNETIFDTLTPAWHDKYYRCDINAKADEEIKIQVEWLPHSNDTKD